MTVTVLPLAVALLTDDMLLLNADAASAFSMLMVKATSAPVSAPTTDWDGLLTQSTPLRTWMA